MNNLSDEQKQQLADAINSRLSEFFDGFVLVGVLAGTEQVVAVMPPMMSPLRKIALATSIEATSAVVGELPEPE